MIRPDKPSRSGSPPDSVNDHGFHFLMGRWLRDGKPEASPGGHAVTPVGAIPRRPSTINEQEKKMSETLQANEVVKSGGTMQQVKTAYTTAVSVQIPRQLKEVNRRLKDEALMAGESFYYGWGAGKDQIEGPSINLAMSAARCWGNCAVDLDDVQDLGDSWIFTAVFIDVETGFTLKRQFRQSKTSIVYGKHDEERKADIRFQIGQSKAVRNVVVNAIPKHLVREAIETAKRGVREKIERRIASLDQNGQNGLAVTQDAAVDQLKRVGVSEVAVLAKLGRPTVKAITVDDLVVLMGDLVAINDGSDRADELFPAPQDEETNATTGVMDHLSDEEPEKKPEPEPEPQADHPGTEEKPEPEGKKAASKGSKSKSEAKTEEPPTPDTPQEPEPVEMATIEDIDAWAKGSAGEKVAEAVAEIKSRYNRLGDDLDALDKAAIDWPAIERESGEVGLVNVRSALAYYEDRAEREGMGKGGEK